MKNSIKLMLFLIILLFALLLIPNHSNAVKTATDENSLLDAVSTADYGETVSLQNNITVTQPIVIAKELIIDGNGYTVTGASSWTSTSGNQTMFTAQLSDAKLTLKDINLRNGPKYGVQSYDGATVILDNVSISGFKYGGVLANGGKVEVRDLHLGYNGTTANNGIEIDKGAAATNSPTLVMNGSLSSDTTENVIRVAENGSLTDFTITNTDTTTNKVALAGNRLVLTDKNNNVIAESSIPDKATPNADTNTIILTLVANNKTAKITVDAGKPITSDLLKSHIVLDDNYVIDGFYTDEKYTKKFDFDTVLNSDTTIYAKISKKESPVTKPESDKVQNDNTPKTGVNTYVGIAVSAIVLSASMLVYIGKKHFVK